MAAAGGGGSHTTDVLETRFEATGLPDLLNGLQQASRAMLGLAAAAANLGQFTYPLFFAFFRASAGMQLLAAGAFATVGAIKAAHNAFIPFEHELIRLDVALAHTGQSFNIQQWRQFAMARAALIGGNPTDTIRLAEQLTLLKLTQSQVQTMIPVLQDAAAARLGGQTDPVAIGRDLIQAVQAASSRPELLTRLGLDPNKIMRTVGAVQKLNEALREIDSKVHGTAEALALPIDKLQASWQNMLISAGDALEPLINLLIRALDGLTMTFQRFAPAAGGIAGALIGGFAGGAIGGLFGGPAAIGPGAILGGLLLGSYGLMAGNQSTTDQRRIQQLSREQKWQQTVAGQLAAIEANTRRGADSLALQNLGNIGPRTAAALTTRLLLTSVRGG